MKEKRIEKNNDIRKANVSLILDSYDDLFSDFDPRDYSEKGLSVDFVDECKRAVRDKEKGTELNLLVPSDKRNNVEEILIKKRIKDHFTKRFNEQKKEVRRIKTVGLAWFFSGVIVSIIAALFLVNHESFWAKFLIILLEPASWFFFWEGLYKVFITSKEEMPEYEFDAKMAEAKVTFSGY